LVYAARNALAPLNIRNTLTFESFIVQPVMSWSKAAAWRNISCMVHTADTSHELMSWLKAAAPLNIVFMSVTSDTSQPGMSVRPASPQAAKSAREQHSNPEGTLARQASTAVFRAARSANAAAELPLAPDTASARSSKAAGRIPVDAPGRARERTNLEGAITIVGVHRRCEACSR